jgi:hypothetical protein
MVLEAGRFVLGEGAIARIHSLTAPSAEGISKLAACCCSCNLLVTPLFLLQTQPIATNSVKIDR